MSLRNCMGCLPTAGGRPVVRGGSTPAGGVCLEGYQTDVDDSIFTTANPALVATGKTLVTPAGFPAGMYRFGCSYVMGLVSEFEPFKLNIQLDGGGFIYTPNHDEEVVDDDDGERWVYARNVCLVLAAGVHTFEIFIGTDFNDPQTIRETTMELWRVA